MGKVGRGIKSGGVLGIHYIPVPIVSGHLETVWAGFIYGGVRVFNVAQRQILATAMLI